MIKNALLEQLTCALRDNGYGDISHQRISHQRNHESHQGLTRAAHPRFGQVMIKWLASYSKTSSQDGLLADLQIMTTTAQIAPPLWARHHFTPIINHQLIYMTALVMPYYAHSLAQLIKTPLTHDQKYQLIHQSAQALAALHQSGWLHNDIKPSNVLIDQKDVKLSDFALAVRADKADLNQIIAGTPSYLAPERWQGQSATMASDVYAFGVMMFEVLTNSRPFIINKTRANPLQAWAVQHCQRPIPTLPKPYAAYQAIIDNTLAKRREHRYHTMREVLADLNGI